MAARIVTCVKVGVRSKSITGLNFSDPVIGESFMVGDSAIGKVTEIDLPGSFKIENLTYKWYVEITDEKTNHLLRFIDQLGDANKFKNSLNKRTMELFNQVSEEHEKLKEEHAETVVINQRLADGFNQSTSKLVDLQKEHHEYTERNKVRVIKLARRIDMLNDLLDKYQNREFEWIRERNRLLNQIGRLKIKVDLCGDGE